MRFEWDPRKAKLNLRKHQFLLKRQLRHFVIRFRQLAPIPIIPLAKIDS